MTVADLSRRYDLTPKEIEILAILAQSPGDVVPRAALPAASYNALSVHIHNINRKLPKRIQVQCMWGLGYSLPRPAAVSLKRIVSRPCGDPVSIQPSHKDLSDDREKARYANPSIEHPTADASSVLAQAQRYSR